jgi:hypothetical protein
MWKFSAHASQQGSRDARLKTPSKHVIRRHQTKSQPSCHGDPMDDGKPSAVQKRGTVKLHGLRAFTPMMS